MVCGTARPFSYVGFQVSESVERLLEVFSRTGIDVVNHVELLDLALLVCFSLGV